MLFLTRLASVIARALVLAFPLALGLSWAAGRGDSAEPSADWWSLRPLRAVPVPNPPPSTWGPLNEIDRFVMTRLAAENLAPAPPADRRTLARRLSFDLTGLPPTPEEVREFVNDESAEAYERLVDRLLSSPRYGERWARHWMDAVHFAETHGHDQDRIREHAWPYRDYLIDSFNRDVPYARFVAEQLAGDVLFPEDPRATVALGFLAAGPWDESSLRDIREDTIDRQIGRYLDRDDIVTTVMQTFTSTTVQCARCHDHKFDPVPQSDYYALQAVFAGVDKANREYSADSAVQRRGDDLRRRLAAVERRDRDLLLGEPVQSAVAQWEKTLVGPDTWKVLDAPLAESTSGVTFSHLPDGSLLAGGQRPERDTYTIVAASPIRTASAVRLEVLSDESLPMHGPGRQDNGNLHLSEFQLQVIESEEAVRDLRIRQAAADFDQDGWTIQKAIDGREETAWGIFPRVGQSHEAVFELAEKVELPAAARIRFVLKQLHGRQHLIGRLRLAVTDSDSRLLRPVPAEVRAVLEKPAGSRSDEDRIVLAAFCERQRIEVQLAALPVPRLVYAAASQFAPDGGHKPAGRPRPVQVLRRGDIRQPLHEAHPGALHCVAGIPAQFELPQPLDEGSRRAALARWLSHPENPLTWRSIVNRVWYHHFGRGLVETPNDFGRMGAQPSHPELLDWLALWFRDHDGSLKALHRLIVTSATYRQNTRHVDDFAARDADNRLLWRMNRTRLDAECIRDSALAIAGRLDLRMGGPSDRQFDLQPGIHVTPRVEYSKFDLDSDAGRRRSVYRFLFRTLPDPLMDSLDCPAGDQLTAVRNASVTVQQALALWNSAFMTRQCEHLAQRVQSQCAADDARVAAAFELILGRVPTSDESAACRAYAERHGLANLARLLFNSNEFLFVN